ncbi:LamG domain-containing protein [Streptomyces canus]|uniref:LamG domain-containing protein n=1 Tax=Streptomyces canus TaxID=58343 RepID=UPI0032528853
MGNGGLRRPHAVRRRRARIIWLTALAALVTTPGLAPPLAAPPAAAVERSALSETEQAQLDAQESGERVEVVGERTERETVFANPDGETFTLDKSIVPVRVEKPGSGWVEPDATLVKRADGSVGPKAAVVDLSFSPGGDGEDLVTIGEAGQSVTLGWPSPLPEPRLEGQRAVYENVLPDVNLILTATVEGFRQVLEVETLQAAKGPELASLEYSMAADGLNVREGAAGSMEATDGNGQVVFRSPSARMWNSAGAQMAGAEEKGISPQTESVTPMQASSAGEERPAGPIDEGDPLTGPGMGDEAAVMDVDVTASSVVVTPDTGLIASTTAAELPLYIDPSVDMGESERTVLSSDGDVFYNFSGGDNGMSVGRCGSAVIGGYLYSCTSGSAYTNRMYFEFAPGKLKGKHVLSAQFEITETWSFSCDPRWVDLERTNGISSSSKWPGPRGPKSDNSWDQMSDRYVSAGRGGNCDPSQPRAPIIFADNTKEEPDENLTPTVKAFADGKFSTLTLMLMAKDESDPIAWKRFDDDATIQVTYVGKPATPTAYGLDTGSAEICAKESAPPTMWSDPTPNLAATAQTASGGEADQSLRVYFDVDVFNADGTWSDAKEPTSGSESPPTGYTRDGAAQNKDWDATLADKRQYRYRAATSTYYNKGASKLSSAWTEYCYFTVDSTAPKPPTIKFDSVYSPCLPGSCTVAGKPNVAGKVTFGPAAGDVNAAYRYKLSTDSAWRAWKTGTTVTEPISPVDSGTITLTVQARDGANRPGGENAVRFLVGESDGPIGWWTFNEASGAAVDVSASAAAYRDDATISAGVRVTTGRRGVVTENGATGEDKALNVGGQGYAATAGKLLETQASYTVAAWARLAATGTTQTVLGQNGVNSSPFFLGYCAGTDRWCLRLADADTSTTALDNQRVDSLQAPQTKVWTHLAAVVDTSAAGKSLTLYVNGIKQGSDALTTGGWSADGALQIGRVKSKGAFAEYFAGDIDEVKVWQEVKNEGQLVKEAALKGTDDKAFMELVAHYAPDGADGTSLPDLSGYGNTLSLSSGASLDGEALVLDGTGAATLSRPVVADTGSFTAATKVAVSTKDLLGKPDGYRAQVLGQRTASGSSWSLWVEKTGMVSEPVVDDEGNPVYDDEGNPVTKAEPTARWHFGRLTTDGSGTSVVSKEDAVLNSEVDLVGAYDAQTRTITLYVGSDAQSPPKAYTASVGSGEFAAGKGWTNSAWNHYLSGRITDIRLWAGAVKDVDQVESVVF